MKMRISKIVIFGIMFLMIVSTIQFTITASNQAKVEPVRTQSAGTEIWRIVLNESLDSLSAVNDHVTKGRENINSTYYKPYEDNITIGYSSDYHAAKLGATRNVSWGRFFISGWEPALETNISFDFKVLDYGFNNPYFWFRWDGFKTGVGDLRNKVAFTNYWWTAAGTSRSASTNSLTYGYGLVPWLRLSFHWHENGTVYTTFANASTPDDILWQNWNYTHHDHFFDDQPQMTPGYFELLWGTGSSAAYETYYYMYLRNLTQTIPVTVADVYADVPTQKYAGLGFDHIFNSTAENLVYDGTFDSMGITATWYFDYTYEGDGPYLTYSDRKWNATDMQRLLEDYGQEFGIHYSLLDPMDTYGTTTEIDTHRAYLFRLADRYGWDDCNIAWTNYQARADVEYSDYAWNTYHDVSKKFWACPFNNQGLWESEYYNMTLWLAQTGTPYTGIAHIVRDDWPWRMAQGISTSDFLAIAQAFIDSGTHIVGQMEYWSRYAAPWYLSGAIDNLSSYEKTVTIDYDYLKLHSPVEVHAALAPMGLTGTEDFELFDDNDTQINYTLDSTEFGAYMVFDGVDGHIYTVWLPMEYQSYIIGQSVAVMAAVMIIGSVLGVVGRTTKRTAN